ncbi:hypothetical protein F4810DRAFT_726561 [Camillea tinctor]|nr:hypothetical protein F4810DRAFT_726561 [Camillea tinctor]
MKTILRQMMRKDAYQKKTLTMRTKLWKNINSVLLLYKLKTPDEPIRCSLHVESFKRPRHDRNSYRALSYAWDDDSLGNMEHVIQIYLEGSVDDTVPKAKSVLVWLGPTRQQDSLFKEFVVSILATKDLDDVAKGLQDKEPHRERCLEFAHFLRRPWFSRRWVIQEVVLAKSCKIQFGDTKITWDNFSAAVHLFTLLCKQLKSPKNDPFLKKANDHPAITHPEATTAYILTRLVDTVEQRSTLHKVINPTWNLETLVMKCRPFLSSKKRDTIYSLMGIPYDMLYGESNKPKLQVAYDKDTSDSDVYVSFVQYCVETSGCLDIICRPWAQKLDEGCSEIPSFVGEAGTMSSYSVAFDLKHDNKFTVTYEVTYIVTYSVDSIVLASNYVSRVSSRKSERSSTNGKDIPDKVWRSLVADRDSDGAPTWYREAFSRIVPCLKEPHRNMDIKRLTEDRQ